MLTFHGAKGLTFDTIIMPQLTKRWFQKLDEEQIERLLFIGITRATNWVYMSATESSQIPALQKLYPLVIEGCLTIQRPDVSVTGQPGLPGFQQQVDSDYEEADDSDDVTGIL